MFIIFFIFLVFYIFFLCFYFNFIFLQKKKTFQVEDVYQWADVTVSKEVTSKTNFAKMHKSLMCTACHLYLCTEEHLLECGKLMESNQLVTYIPTYGDLFGMDEDDQVYVAQIILQNAKLLKVYEAEQE